MKKKLFTLFIGSLSLAMGFTSCSDEAFDIDSVNKQTILVYYPWTGSANSSGLTSFLNNNVDSICRGIIDKKGLDNTRVLLFMSSSYNRSTLYDLQYDDSKRTVNRVPLREYEGMTYATAEGIAELLNEVKTRAEALNYALIIGAHGCGWTSASDWQNYPYYTRPNNTRPNQVYNTTSTMSAISAMGTVNSQQASDNFSGIQQGENFSGIQFGADPNNPLTRFFGSVSMKDLSTDVTALAEGIKQSGLTMQYILFDACYMGNVETAYELKDVTNYMISSSSEIMGAGLPYRSLWNMLNSATPNYSNIVSTSVNFYRNQLADESPYLNLAAIDCRQLDKLASVMREINSKHSLSSTVPLDSIQPLDGFGPNLFYDMSVYVDSLHPSGYLKDQYTAQMKLTVKAADHTKESFTSLKGGQNGTTFKVKSYCGLSISDPSQHRVAAKGKERTGWWRATH